MLPLCCTPAVVHQQQLQLVLPAAVVDLVGLAHIGKLLSCTCFSAQTAAAAAACPLIPLGESQDEVYSEQELLLSGRA